MTRIIGERSSDSALTIPKLINLGIIALFITSWLSMLNGFNLRPYLETHYQEYVFIDIMNKVNFSSLHPFYSPFSYIPLSLRLVPSCLLFNPVFNMSISVLINFIYIWLLLFLCIGLVRFSLFESIFFVLLVLTVLYFPLHLNIPPPNPFTLYNFYNFRSVVPFLIGFGLCFLYKRRLLLAGVLFGLIAVVHIKFGARFFAFILLSCVLWDLIGVRLLRVNNWRFRLPDILAMAAAFFAAVSPTLLEIFLNQRYLWFLSGNRTAALISPLAWLYKNEPDDWLISSFPVREMVYFGILVTLTLAVWEYIRRKETKYRIPALVMEIAVSLSAVFYISGMIFEQFLVSFVNQVSPNLALSIILVRFWDMVWIPPLGFILAAPILLSLLQNKLARLFRLKTRLFNHIGILLILAGLILNERLLARLSPDGALLIGSKLAICAFQLITISMGFFLLFAKDGAFSKILLKLTNNLIPAIVIIFIVLVSIFRIPFRLSSGGSPETAFESKYIQICSAEEGNRYNLTLSNAVRHLKAGSSSSFYQSLRELEGMYIAFLGNKSRKEWNNPDVWNLIALNELLHSRFPQAFRYLSLSADYQQQDGGVTFWQRGDVGKDKPVSIKQVSLPLKSYKDITGWMSKNLPLNAAIIQPPYITGFNMHSRRIGFWDGKVDQHSMYMLPGYYTLGLNRLHLVAGYHTIETNPGFTSGDVNVRGRAFYLRLTEDDFRRIKGRYPDYSYILTEKEHKLKFPVLTENDYFILYKII